MPSSIVLFCADTQLERLDYSLMSDQSLMEMLICDFGEEAKQQFQDSDGLFLDVCEWSFVSCDSDENVIKVKKTSGMSGSASLSHMPAKVRTFQMKDGGLFGTLETATLPRCLREFDIHKNKFYGSVDLTALPAAIIKCIISDNSFSGSINLTKLPATLNELYVSYNRFSGTLSLSNLPRNLLWLSLSSNTFSGEFRFENPPERFRKLHASANSFEETAVVPKGCYVDLVHSGVTSIVDVEGNRHPHETHMLSQREIRVIVNLS